MKPYTIATDRLPKPEEVQALCAQTTWAAERDLESIRSLLATNPVRVTVYLGDQLVGFGRAVSDGVYRALLDDIIVDSAHRGNGLGKAIVDRLVEQLEDVEELYLNTGPDLEGFYAKSGFKKNDGLTMKRSNG